VDIAYVSTQEDFLYLAFILDAHSPKTVGWSMCSHMKTELAVYALQMAVWSVSQPHDSGITPIAAPSRRRSRSTSASKSRHRSFDGKDRNRPGHNATAESFVAKATFGSELPEPRRLPGGYNERSGCGLDATRPRDRGDSRPTGEAMIDADLFPASRPVNKRRLVPKYRTVPTLSCT
jgi:transposase InsO family protein